jgi:hypothetical protein
VLFFLKNNPQAIDEEIYQDLSDYITEEGIKNERLIRGMIASASKAVTLRRSNDSITEKQILKEIVHAIPQITIEIENN